MAEGASTHVLAAVRLPSIVKYRENLTQDHKIRLTLATSEAEARQMLNEAGQHTDVFVIDNGLCDAYTLIKNLRQTYPRLLIILVDEDADFGMPGNADEVSVAPFEKDDLLRRIRRLTEERRLQTLRADALPPVRSFAKSLRKTAPGKSKQQAAVEAIKELGYDYVAFYTHLPTDPPELELSAQVGTDTVKEIAPAQQSYSNTLLGWVSANGQSRIVSPGDELNHPFVTQQRFGSGVAVPVGASIRFGVILACRTQQNAITRHNIMMLELISAQLASALAKETRS